MYPLQLIDVRKAFEIDAKRSPSSTSNYTIAIENVSFHVGYNEFVSVIGPSGCGKTTLLRVAAGLSSPDQGEVRIDGQVVREPSSKIAMVFQNIGLLPWRSAIKNVEFGIELKQHRRLTEDERSLCSQYLQLVGLSGFENHYPYQLSGGMQQRVGLARALAREPEILLMDEPFGSLDGQTRLILQDELLKIREKAKTTLLFVTHDIDEATYLSDRIIILTKRPSRTKMEIPVDLPGPRYTYDVRADLKFLEIRNKAWNALKEEIPQNAGNS